MKKVSILIFIFSIYYTLFTNICYAQGTAINTTGATADPSAILDVSATGKGILIPRMSTANRPANPVEALLIYNTTTQCFEAYNSATSQWISIACLGGCILPAAPIAGTHVPSKTQIVWNWNAVSGAKGYKYNTVNSYASATDNGVNTFFTQIGLTCNTPYSLYIWAYNDCGNSTVSTLTQTTSSCMVFNCGTTLTDSRDNKTYPTVQIGTQCWMAQNLNYGKFVTLGTSPQGTGNKYCENSLGLNDNTCPYGGLYEWATMMNGSVSCNGIGAVQPGCSTPVQGLCPSGWHIPSHYEWTLLEKNVGINPDAFPYDETTSGFTGTDEGKNLKSITGWGDSTQPPANLNANSSGFTALPGGMGWYLSGTFTNILWNGFWWTCTEKAATTAWNRSMNAWRDNTNRAPNLKSSAFSIRCIKD